MAAMIFPSGEKAIDLTPWSLGICNIIFIFGVRLQRWKTMREMTETTSSRTMPPAIQNRRLDFRTCPVVGSKESAGSIDVGSVMIEVQAALRCRQYGQ